MRQPQRQKSNAQTANIKQKIIAADKGYEVSDIPFSLVSLYLLSQSLTSNKAAHLNPNEFSRLGNSTKLVQVIGTCTIFSFTLRNPEGAFSVLFRKKERENHFFSQISDFHLFRNLRGKTKLLWSHPAVKDSEIRSQPSCWPLLARRWGAPHWTRRSYTPCLWVTPVGPKISGGDFVGIHREKWLSDFGRLDLPSCQILAIGWMQLEKKSTLNWSWRFLGFSGEVEVWCSQIHRFLFCSVLFPKRGQSSQSEP